MQYALGFITPLDRRWRIDDVEEIVCLSPILRAVTVGVAAVSFVPSQHVVLASATIGGGAFALVGAAGLRVCWRLNAEPHREPAGRPSGR
jgi:hypothetical protein